MSDFSSVLSDISQVSTVGATFLPFGSFVFGANAAQNTNGLVGTLGSNATAMFKGVTGSVTGFLSNPVVMIGAGCVLLILLK